METFEVTFEAGPLGMGFLEEDGRLVIKALEKGAAAAIAGLQPGCTLVTVNGKHVQGIGKRTVLSLIEAKGSNDPRALTFSGPLAVALAVKAAKAKQAAAKQAVADAAKAVEDAKAAAQRAKQARALKKQATASRLAADTAAKEVAEQALSWKPEPEPAAEGWSMPQPKVDPGLDGALAFFQRQETVNKIAAEVEKTEHRKVTDLENGGVASGSPSAKLSRVARLTRGMTKKKKQPDPLNLLDDPGLNIGAAGSAFARRRPARGSPVITATWTITQRVHHARISDDVKMLIREHVAEQLRAAAAARLKLSGSHEEQAKYAA